MAAKTCSCETEDECDGCYCPISKERVCNMAHNGKELHEFVGPAYFCSGCHEWCCKDHMLDDEWEERMEDDVFLCLACYKQELRLSWIG